MYLITALLTVKNILQLAGGGDGLLKYLDSIRNAFVRLSFLGEADESMLAIAVRQQDAACSMS